MINVMRLAEMVVGAHTGAEGLEPTNAEVLELVAVYEAALAYADARHAFERGRPKLALRDLELLGNKEDDAARKVARLFQDISLD